MEKLAAMDTEATVVWDCELCLPHWKCRAIGKEGLLDARIIQVVKNGNRGILWSRIEKCATKGALPARAEGTIVEVGSSCNQYPTASPSLRGSEPAW